MRPIFAALTLLIFTGSVFAATGAIVSEDNQAYDMFFQGPWVGNVGSWDDNFSFPTYGLASNNPHIYQDGGGDRWMGVYRGATGDTVRVDASYTVSAADVADFEPENPWIFNFDAKATVNRVDSKAMRMQGFVRLNGANQTTVNSYGFTNYETDPLGDPLPSDYLYIGNPSWGGAPGTAWTIDGPVQQDVGLGQGFLMTIAEGDSIGIRFEMQKNWNSIFGNQAKNIGLAVDDAELAQAVDGDANLDKLVDASDIGALLAGFGTGTEWSEGDFTGDDLVDAADIGGLLTNFTGDPGPAPAGSVIAEYDPATGQIIVSVDGVQNWLIEAADGAAVMTGDPANLPGAGGLVTDNDFRVGESNFGGPFSYTDLDLGNVAIAGLVQGDLIAKWQTGFGAPTETIEVVVIPEPASMMLLGLGGLLVLRRRRAA